MTKSESIAKLAEALSLAQAEIIDAHKDKQGYGYNYADLASCLTIARPVLSKHGLSIVQMPGNADSKVTLETMLMHKSGEWIANTLEMGIEKGKGMSMAQSVGCVITYARRYALTAFVGIAQTDTDAAVQPAVQQPPAQPVHIVPSDIKEIKDRLVPQLIGAFGQKGVKAWLESNGLHAVNSASKPQLNDIEQCLAQYQQSQHLDEAMA